MIKTQVQLQEWQYQAAKRESARASRSLSDLVREGLAMVLQRSATASRGDLEALAGKYTAQPADDLKPHDSAWVEAIR